MERFGRLAQYSLDPENKRLYGARAEQWKKAAGEDKNGIIGEKNISGVPEVHTIGRIDKAIYSCITEDIVTDEVIITDNQIQHIKERHPQDYQNILDKVKDVISSPEYIIYDSHPNTGLVIGNVFENGEAAQVVLRIVTSADEQGYKNSIISCWKISAKRLQNYLRNKLVLYKK